MRTRSGALALLVLLLLAPALPAQADSSPGVGAWRDRGISESLRRSGADWFHTWSTEHPGIRTPRGTTFVPTIWGAGSVTRENLRRAREARSPWLMTFNEPDLAEQSHLTVRQALRLWPRLERTGKRLLSPSVAYGGADPGGWLDRFMKGAERRGLRVDAISVHWYGGDFHPRRATQQLASYLRAVHARYGKPVWLTEYALMSFGPTRVPSPRVQAAFVRRSSAMLDRLGFVQRHAWFGLPAAARGPSTGLFRPGARITAVGKAFRRAALS
ncbi:MULTISPECIES: glycosyl hydrolase [unclassified Nocardioides]|uniref:glycosyl hydrolase n=1 Tax=unclassified Nocardioides TaxID=2615069 RepID=UPI0030145872